MQKILSIIIPTYNMEKILDVCLSSLLINDKELFQCLEVIVVNDGSKDSSSSIAHRYQDSYPNTFIVIDKENGNYGSCINVGLKVATGKYIRVLDADDHFDTEALECYLQELLTVDSDLIITNTIAIDEKTNEEVIFRCYSEIPQKMLVPFSIEHAKYLMNSIQISDITYRTAILREISYKQTEGIFYTDAEWRYEPFVKVKYIYYINKTIYVYRAGQESQSMNPNVLARHSNDLYLLCESLAKRYEDWVNMMEPQYQMYLQERLERQLVYVYNMAIYGIYKDYDIRPLDKTLKEKYPLVYALSEDLTIYDGSKFRFIAHWRDGAWYYVKLFCLRGWNTFYSEVSSAAKDGLLGSSVATRIINKINSLVSHI